MSDDAHDILGGSTSSHIPRRQAALPSTNLTNVDKKVVKRPEHLRRPAGMHRELFNLFVHQGKDSNKDKIDSLMPTNTKRGYTVVKAQLGKRVVHKWVHKPFVNEARTDGLQLQHWERQDKIDQQYQFARFNKQLDPLTFTDEEYEECLVDPRWTREETDHLLELCQRFDLRWPIIEDRFDKERFCKEAGARKTMEDMKERYYGLVNELNAARGSQEDPLAYDADHERRRKEQLIKLWDRTEEQIKEEEELKEAVKRIEAKRKDREKKAHDLQRLINNTERVSLSPDSSTPGTPSMMGTGRAGAAHRRSQLKRAAGSSAEQLISADQPHIRWPEFKQPGPHLRSQEMKLPSNTGQQKLNNIGKVVTERQIVSIGIEYPHAFEEIVRMYNDLRSNIVLLQELKTNVLKNEQELDQLAHWLRTERDQQHVRIEPRLRVSGRFYEELEQNPDALLETPAAAEESSSPGKEGGKGGGGGGGKGKGGKGGKQQQQPKLAPVTNRAICRLIEVNTPSVAQTRKRRAQLGVPESTPTRSSTAAAAAATSQQ